MYKSRTSGTTQTQQVIEINDWVKLAQTGNEEAFANLYTHFHPIVHRRVWHMIPKTDVDDVTQEVFIAVIKSLRSFRGEAKFSTWLNTLTSRQVANYYRKRARHLDGGTEHSDIEDEQYRIKDHKQDMSKMDDNITLRLTLASLPDHYQEILLLRFVDGLRFKEISVELDKTLDATKSLFRRAMSTLKEEIEQ